MALKHPSTQEGKKDKISDRVSHSIWTLLKKMDWVPVFKKSQPLAFTQQLFHTFVGFTLYVVLFMTPLAGFYHMKTIKKFSIAFVTDTSLVAVVRNALLISTMLSEIMFGVLFSKDFRNGFNEQEKSSAQRGVRNLYIIVGLTKKLYEFVYKELNTQVLFLGSDAMQDWIFLTAVHITQVLIGALCAIIIDDYLEYYSICGRNKMAYYQLVELVVMVFYADPLINYKYWGLLAGIFIILINVVVGSLFTTSYTLQHNTIKGYAKKQTLKPSMLKVNATVIAVLLKTMIMNSLTLFILPGVSYAVGVVSGWLVVASAWGPRYAKLKDLIPYVQAVTIPQWVINCPLINQRAINWDMLPFMDVWFGPVGLRLIKWWLIDSFIFTPFLLYNIAYFTPELRAQVLVRRFKANNLSIRGVAPTQGAMVQHLNQKIKTTIWSSILLSVLSEVFLPIIPVYGLVLKAATLTHMCNLIENISSSIKEIPKQEKENYWVLKNLISWIN